MSLGETVAPPPELTPCSRNARKVIHPPAAWIERSCIRSGGSSVVGGGLWALFQPSRIGASFLVAAIKIGCFCCPGAEACACTVICRRIPTGTDRILFLSNSRQSGPCERSLPPWRANSGNYRSHGPVRSPRRPPGCSSSRGALGRASHSTLQLSNILSLGPPSGQLSPRCCMIAWIPATRLLREVSSTGRHPQPMVFMSLPTARCAHCRGR